jgi:hypothetical protein
MTQRTTTGLVDMEHSLGIIADNMHGSTTASQSQVDQEHPAPPRTSESPARSSLWPAEVLYEHDFYTDVWYTDIIARILILVYPCGVFIVVKSSEGDGRVYILGLIIPSHWLPPLFTFCLYFFLYTMVCICSKLYPNMACFWTTHTHCRRFGLLLLLTSCLYLFINVDDYTLI